LHRHKLLYIVGSVVFDEIAGVCEGDDGIGHVLTEDHHQVARVPDESAEDGLGHFLYLGRLEVRQQPTQGRGVVKQVP
jgi:hypothetical protein